MSKKPNVRLIQRYNVNLDKDTAVVLSRAFNDVFLDFQKEKIRKNTTIKLSDKTKKNIDLIIKHFEDFIKDNNHEDDVETYEIKSIRKQYEDWEYNIEFVKKLWILFNKLDTLDLLLFVLEEKKSAIKFLRTIANFWNIIPFEKFSIQEILYKKFEKIIDDKNKEIDSYKNINTSIVSMIFSSISAIWALFTIQILPVQFQSFIYWFIIVLWLVFIYYFAYFISNLFQIRKNKYILDSLYAFTEPFDEPEKNINEEYIDYVSTFLKQVRDFRKSDESIVDFDNWKKALKLFMLHRTWKDYRFYFWVLLDLIKEKWVFILVILSYFLFFYFVKDNFIYFLTSK